MITRYDIYSDGGDYGSSPLITQRDSEGKWVMFEDVDPEINSWKSKAQKWEQDLGVAKSKCFKLDAKVSELEAEVERLRADLASVEAWTHRYGSDLVPQFVDSYGEGVRAAKSYVSSLLNRAAAEREIK